MQSSMQVLEISLPLGESDGELQQVQTYLTAFWYRTLCVAVELVRQANVGPIST